MIIRRALQGFFLLFETIRSTFCILMGRPIRPKVFWDHVQNQTVGTRQAYIYSVSDKITDSVEIDKLIDYRRQHIPNAQIIATKFDVSPHVMHYPSHPKEYATTVNDILGMATTSKM
eukprot:CAMPEP_0116840066 /NCGR_PEP_ID=MMETSP0418-20121206/10127_1 /TAXON_ID=1158023 /ORGANISM="Astrosyne radiata, Strain 13vi08-1A" /LENGTH=116 /DNA_ID=CAMNT_0004470269 /DNA_START=198 /DNA_END=548 /DNA_ORIENTATION=-